MLFLGRVANQTRCFHLKAQPSNTIPSHHPSIIGQIMASPLFILSFIIFFISQLQTQSLAQKGRWDLLQQSIGITAMHMQLMSNDRVVIFDRTDFGLSNISLPDGKCRNNSNELVVKIDCTAHSVEYDVSANSVRALTVQTDVWCSSGALTADGQLIQTGGFNDGERIVRTFNPCSSCDWQEVGLGLIARRWYATNHILPDGRVIVIGGRRQFNYEFYPKTSTDNKVFNLPFLSQTRDGNNENNLYPFVHLNVDGNLFIFANNRAILFDYTKNVVVKTFPSIPGGDPRNYPSTGSSALLPLTSSNAAEVLICGGAPNGSYAQVSSGTFVWALSTCGRIIITDKSPQWTMEAMPFARCMGDMVLLPNGNVLIINGVSAGTAGWEVGRNPVLSPVLYKPGNPAGSRFEVLNPSTIPRVYHSTAILLRDGRVLVGGSNPHVGYSFTGVLFPTELRLEAFSPDYLDSKSSSLRPKILSPTSQAMISYGKNLIIRFSVSGSFDGNTVSGTMVAPSFTTHSFSMNQRLLVLRNVGKPTNLSSSTYQVQVTAPNSGVLAPSGYYMLFVVHKSIPSEGIWVKIK